MSHPQIFLYSDKMLISILFLYSVINQQSESLSIKPEKQKSEFYSQYKKSKTEILKSAFEKVFQKTKNLKIFFIQMIIGLSEYLSIYILNKYLSIIFLNKKLDGINPIRYI